MSLWLPTETPRPHDMMSNKQLKADLHLSLLKIRHPCTAAPAARLLVKRVKVRDEDLVIVVLGHGQGLRRLRGLALLLEPRHDRQVLVWQHRQLVRVLRGVALLPAWLQLCPALQRGHTLQEEGGQGGGEAPGRCR
jgi:hypothetical protein